MPKILIADDSIAVRKVAERLLTEAGMGVTLAANGSEALAMLAKDRPDLIVSDVIMPDKSGYVVCAFIRGQANLADLPVLLISGIVNDEVSRQAETCKADGVLKKPFQGSSLKDRVLDLLTKRPHKPAPVSEPIPIPISEPPVIAEVAPAPVSPMQEELSPGPSAQPECKQPVEPVAMAMALPSAASAEQVRNQAGPAEVIPSNRANEPSPLVQADNQYQSILAERDARITELEEQLGSERRHSQDERQQNQLMMSEQREQIEREFYAEMCRIEGWNVRTLAERIDSMLYERTALSRKPEALIRAELEALRARDQMAPSLVLKDPYVLDFLGVTDRYVERDHEDAILRDLEAFLLELGAGFAFVARQKRIQIDGDDYYIDLLFYNRLLRRLVAVDLKLGRFKPGDKGQMELYLRWLERYERAEQEERPLGLILCADKKAEQVELLAARVAGLESAADLRLADGDLVLRGSYTLLATINLGDDPNQHGRGLPGRPRHDLALQASLGHTWRARGRDLEPRLVYTIDHVARTFLDASGRYEVPRRTIHGLGVELHVARRVHLTAHVRNLFNQRTTLWRPPIAGAPAIAVPIADFFFYPLPGTSFWASVRLDLDLKIRRT